MNSKNDVRKEEQPYFYWKVIYILSLPAILMYLYRSDVIPPVIFQSFLIFFLVLLISPIVFKFHHPFRRSFIFVNIVNLPRFAKFHRPEYHGLNGTRNLYLESNDGVRLGIWHILPKILIKENLSKEEEEEYFEKTLSYDYPIVVYMHGNTNNRAASHHIELHKTLRRNNYHVFTFDYRGYGDSTGDPQTEDLVVSDAIAVLRWIRQCSTAPIIVWGHSLGSGVALHAIRKLTEENDCFVQGVVLETPFLTLKDAVLAHPSSFIFRSLPWFEYMVLGPLHKSGIQFMSEEHIKYVNCPILFLHAEDDWVIPFIQGFKLYLNALQHRKPNQGKIKFEKFPKKLGCGHRHICRAPELSTIIRDFCEQCLQK